MKNNKGDIGKYIVSLLDREDVKINDKSRDDIGLEYPYLNKSFIGACQEYRDTLIQAFNVGRNVTAVGQDGNEKEISKWDQVHHCYLLEDKDGRLITDLTRVAAFKIS